MDITKIASNVSAATTTLSEISVAIPVLVAAYNGLRSIWASQNPGQTEADFIVHLQQSAQLNVDDTAAYLTSQGYVQQADGSWTKP